MEQLAQRIIRVPLPVDVIRGIDRVVESGIGGFGSRTEFILDAVRERILELRYEEADEPAFAQTPRTSAAAAKAAAGRAPAEGLGATALRRVDGFVLDSGIDQPLDEPLFGLHNRDYPSLWALQFLAEATQDAPISLAQFEVEISRNAWEFGRTLQSLERVSGQKLSGLFPTNAEKRGSSEGKFRMFALGDHRRVNGQLRSAGPLYRWQVAGLLQEGDDLMVGVTESGRQLLTSLEGLTAESPHAPQFAEAFLDHLGRHASPDLWGFEHLLGSVASGASTRLELIAAFRAGPYEWTENELSTNVAGYVARAREWGLLTPKQIGRRYGLTEFGADVASQRKGVVG